LEVGHFIQLDFNSTPAEFAEDLLALAYPVNKILRDFLPALAAVEFRTYAAHNITRLLLCY